MPGASAAGAGPPAGGGRGAARYPAVHLSVRAADAAVARQPAALEVCGVGTNLSFQRESDVALQLRTTMGWKFYGVYVIFKLYLFLSRTHKRVYFCIKK